MVSVESVYEGDLHTACTHGPSGAQVATDAPKDNQGRGESFSPTDLVATALGSCMLSIMGIEARRQNWDLVGSRVTVEKHMVQEPVRRIVKLAVACRLPARLSPAAREALEAAAHRCPVCASIHPDIEVPLTFEYVDV